jgi:hypothetical protein
MNWKLLAGACALAMAGTAGQAYAQCAAGTGVLPFDTADETIQLSGATAPDTFIANIAAQYFVGTEGPVDVATGQPLCGFWRFLDAGGGTTTSSQWNGGAATGALGNDGRQFTVFFGEIKNDPAIPASLRGKKIRFIKRSKGGSVWGVNPVARAALITTINGNRHVSLQANGAPPAAGGFDITQLGCLPNWSATVPNPVAISGGAGGNIPAGRGVYSCQEQGVDPALASAANPQNPNVERVSDFGVSDVAPNLFKAPFNVEFGESQLSQSETDNLSVFGLNSLMMGFVATNTVPDYFMTKSNYGSILNGTRRTWTSLGVTLPNVGGASRNSVVVCRRVPGSGTQTSYNWFFSNFPCETNSISGTGNLTPARMTDSAGYADTAIDPDTGARDGYPDTCFDKRPPNVYPFPVVNCQKDAPTVADPRVQGGTPELPFRLQLTGFTVVENSTSGNVRDCLRCANGCQDAATNPGGAHEWRDEQNRLFRAEFGAGGYGAVGVLSLDSFGRESGWSFRSYNGIGRWSNAGGSVGTGIHPTQANHVCGKYEFAVELTMQYRKNAVTYCYPVAADATPGTDGCPAGTDALLVPALGGIKKDFADDFILRAGAPAFQSVATASLPPGQPAGASTRLGTHSTNMCSPLVQIRPTTSGGFTYTCQ